jgi:quercetin dioxygenase-like cupin family protein
MAAASLIRFQDVKPIRRGTRAETIPLVGPEQGSEMMINGVSAFEPGTAIPLHTHNCDEIVVVIEGEGECELDGKVYPVKAYDTTFAPAGIPHCFRNTSQERMRILWTYASTKVTRTILATGETFEHLSEKDRAAVESR